MGRRSIGNASHHYDVVDFPALVKQSARNASNFGETLAIVKPDRRRIVGADGKLHLPDPNFPRVIRNCIQQPFRDARASQFPPNIDHDQRCAVRHLAGALTYEAGDPDGNVILESDEDGVVDGSAPPFVA